MANLIPSPKWPIEFKFVCSSFVPPNKKSARHISPSLEIDKILFVLSYSILPHILFSSILVNSKFN